MRIATQGGWCWAGGQGPIPLQSHHLVYTWNIHGYTRIYMVYPWIYHVYPRSIYVVYPWIYMDIHGISFDVVYTWYIHGYSWIFIAFWNQISLLARAAGFPVIHWQWAQPTKASTRLPPTFRPLSLAAAVTAAATVVSRASFRFPNLVPGNNLNLVERAQRARMRSLQGRRPMYQTA